jgi:hypothetical protein
LKITCRKGLSNGKAVYFELINDYLPRVSTGIKAILNQNKKVTYD